MYEQRILWGNRARPPDVQVVGEYFSGNLGDWTMGQMILRGGRDLSIRAGLTSYSPARHVPCRLIMGGGELGDENHFQLAFKLAESPGRVSACGINPVYTFASLPRPLLLDIAQMPYLSIRSKTGAAMMRKVLSRPDVEYNPDPSFCLSREFVRRPAARREEKRLAISLMTFYLSVQQRKFFAADGTMGAVVADPEFRPLIDTAGERYIQTMREVVQRAIAQGWEVVNIPFSEVDAMFAEAVLKDLKVNRLRFSGNPLQVLSELSTCTKLIAARFHTHIFGLISGTPVVSMGYSEKCIQLWEDLGLNSGLQIGRVELCRLPVESAEKLFDAAGVTLSQDILLDLAGAAEDSIDKAYRAICF